MPPRNQYIPPPLIPNTAKGFEVTIGEYIQDIATVDAQGRGISIINTQKRAISLSCNPDLPYRNLYMYWFFQAALQTQNLNYVDFPVRCYKQEFLQVEIPNRVMGGTAIDGGGISAGIPGIPVFGSNAYYFTASAGNSGLPSGNGFVFVRTHSVGWGAGAETSAPAYITATPLILIGDMDRVDVDVDKVLGYTAAHILFAVASSQV